MYTAPATPEQCLHNTLILVKAMRSIGIDYDIQATDITDPNPISLLMVSFYEKLCNWMQGNGEQPIKSFFISQLGQSGDKRHHASSHGAHLGLLTGGTRNLWRYATKFQRVRRFRGIL